MPVQACDCGETGKTEEEGIMFLLEAAQYFVSGRVIVCDKCLSVTQL